MDINVLIEKINLVIELIFQLNFSCALQNIVEIVELINKNIDKCNKNINDNWKEILQYLMIGLENSDYLLVGDILKYELQPLLVEELSLRR